MTTIPDDEIIKKAKQSLTRPDDFGWWGGDEMFVTWGFAGINLRLNAGDILEESNFHVITKDLMNKYPDDFEIVGCNHWAWGSMDQLTVRVLNDEANHDDIDIEDVTAAFAALLEWHDALADYPVADEMDFSEREYESIHKWTMDELNRLDDCVHIDTSLEEMASDIITFVHDSRGWCADEEPPTEDEIYEFAFEHGLCKFDEVDFWVDWCESKSKTIVWNHYTNLGGKKQEIPGQLKMEFK